MDPNAKTDEWWREQLKGFGWPEEGSRNLGPIEDMYQAFKARLLAELGVRYWDISGPHESAELYALPPRGGTGS